MVKGACSQTHCRHCLVAQSCPIPRPHAPTRLLCPWDFPGKRTGVVCHALLQGTFLTQGSNPRLLPCRVDSTMEPRGEPSQIDYQILKSQGKCQLIITSPSFIFLIWARTPRAYVSLLRGLVGVCKGRGQKACDRREVRFRCWRARGWGWANVIPSPP